MAMSGSQMGVEVAAAIAATSPGGELSGAEQGVMDAQWQVICAAIVAHIQANAVDSQGGSVS